MKILSEFLSISRKAVIKREARGVYIVELTHRVSGRIVSSTKFSCISAAEDACDNFVNRAGL